MKIPPPLSRFFFRANARTKSFTLTELLVVIAIVIVLAGLMLSGIFRALRQSRSVKCLSNLHQIGVAAQAWAADNNLRTVPTYMNGEASVLDPNTWTGLLAPYLNYPSIQTVTSITKMPVFICPESATKCGYGHNYYYLSFSPAASYGYWVPYPRVKDPAQTVFFVDNYTPGNPAKWRGFVRPPSIQNMADSLPSFRHPGNTTHVLWLDGHVSSEMTNSPFTKDDQLWDTN